MAVCSAKNRAVRREASQVKYDLLLQLELAKCWSQTQQHWGNAIAGRAMKAATAGHARRCSTRAVADKNVAHVIRLRCLRAVAQGSQVDHRLLEAVREPARETEDPHQAVASPSLWVRINQCSCRLQTRVASLM